MTTQGPVTSNEAVAGVEEMRRPCEETNVVVSDLHLSEGTRIRVPRRSTLSRRLFRWLGAPFGAKRHVPYVTVKNPCEDFPHDEQFAAFLRAAEKTYADAGRFILHLMGDVFDPLAVMWRGRFSDPPYEVVSAMKMRRIIEGHPVFFDALREFLLGAENRELHLYVGNHDLFLVWPMVQREIVRRIAGADDALAKRIRFFSREERFEQMRGGVLYYHGMNAEFHNVIEPEHAVIEELFGRKLKRPILNAPPGSIMATHLANHLKLRNPLIGRVPEEYRIWKNAALHNRLWGLYAGWRLTIFVLYCFIFAPWYVKRKLTLLIMAKVVMATAQENPVERYAEKVLKERQGIRAIVMGHNHLWRRMSTALGTYVNTGTWSIMFRLTEPHLPLRWKRFRRVETVWRTLLHFLRHGEIRYARRLAILIGYLAFIAILLAFLFATFDGGAWSIMAINPTDLKAPAAIMVGYLVVTGMLRLFAVSPDVEVATKFTFGLVRHFEGGDLSVELMEFVPADSSIKECV